MNLQAFQRFPCVKYNLRFMLISNLKNKWLFFCSEMKRKKEIRKLEIKKNKEEAPIITYR